LLPSGRPTYQSVTEALRLCGIDSTTGQLRSSWGEPTGRGTR